MTTYHRCHGGATFLVSAKAADEIGLDRIDWWEGKREQSSEATADVFGRFIPRVVAVLRLCHRGAHGFRRSSIEESFRSSVHWHGVVRMYSRVVGIATGTIGR